MVAATRATLYIFSTLGRRHGLATSGDLRRSASRKHWAGIGEEEGVGRPTGVKGLRDGWSNEKDCDARGGGQCDVAKINGEGGAKMTNKVSRWKKLGSIGIDRGVDFERKRRNFCFVQIVKR